MQIFAIFGHTNLLTSRQNLNKYNWTAFGLSVLLYFLSISPNFGISDKACKIRLNLHAINFAPLVAIFVKWQILWPGLPEFITSELPIWYKPIEYQNTGNRNRTPLEIPKTVNKEKIRLYQWTKIQLKIRFIQTWKLLFLISCTISKPNIWST